MHLEIDRKGMYSIDMCDYIIKTCEAHMVKEDKKSIFEKGSKLPTGKDLHEVKEDDKLLGKKGQKSISLNNGMGSLPYNQGDIDMPGYMSGVVLWSDCAK